MNLFHYSSEEHSEALKTLLNCRAMQNTSIGDMPKIGIIAFHEKQPLAAGFLRLCEGNCGMFDSFITDPSFDGELRSEALDNIANHLIDIANLLKLNGIIALSVDENTISRSLKHGFKQRPFKVVSLTLNGDNTWVS